MKNPKRKIFPDPPNANEFAHRGEEDEGALFRPQAILGVLI
jgi:hypothetical protein